MSLHFVLQLLRAATRGEPLPPEREKIQSEWKLLKGSKKAIARPQLWTVYGNRGRDPRVQHLSACEFVRCYQDKQSRYPWSLKQHQEQLAEDAAAATAFQDSARTPYRKFHARLTDSGRVKLENRVSRTPGARRRLPDP